jgi:N-acetylglucosaminyl-diphospho-decaprenol L-rhamnosyltransferase
MYGEDTDLCIRARKLGHTCVICPACTLIHHGGQSEKVRAEKMIRVFRAKAQLFRKHWSPAAAWFGLLMLRMWAFTRMAALGVLCRIKPQRATAYSTWREIWLRGDDYCRT